MFIICFDEGSFVFLGFASLLSRMTCKLGVCYNLQIWS